jgi:protein-S-isoprenylcysteine O-methyltransferase Ste14
MEGQNNPKKHKGRDDLQGEHPAGDAIQLILLLLFTGIWIIDSFVLKFSTLDLGSASYYWRIPLAAFCFIVSIVYARAGLKIVFGEVRESAELITRGVFSKLRHPIYFGAIMFYPAFILLTLSIACLLFWCIIVLFYFLISRYEEKLLQQAFGEEYLEYKTAVPMLFPKLF